MNDERNDESGQFTQKYTDEMFLAAVDEQAPLAGTADIAAEVGCTHDTALKRLEELAEQGYINRCRVAGAILWSTDGIEGSV